MNRLCRTLSMLVVALALANTNYGADEVAEKLAAAIRAAQNWNHGEDAGNLNLVSDAVTAAAPNAEQKKALEQLLIRGLADATTRASRDFFCRQLVVIGSEAAVPELAKLLLDPESSHIARFTLARIPGAVADAALLEALGKVDEKLKIGMVHSLGARGCVAAAARINTSLTSSNQDLVVASLAALGRIDSDAAVTALAEARLTLPAKFRIAATDAYLDTAARLLKQNKTAAAHRIYQELFRASEATMCRIAALNGLVATQKDQSVALVVAALADADLQVRAAAAAGLRYVPGAEATRAVVAALDGKNDDVQVMLLAVLADRRDPAALAAVVKAADASSLPVRVAALNALTPLGDTAVVPLLAQRAATSQQATEQQAARSSLNNLRGTAINAEIAKQLTAINPAVRSEAARSLAARSAVDQVPALFQAAEDKEASVAAEALKSLRTLATAEHVPGLVKLLISTKDGGIRNETENTVVAAAASTAANKNPAEAVLAALPRTTDVEVRVSLLKILGRITHAAALPALNEALKDNRTEVKDAAVRALADWPTAEPLKVLLSIATETSAPLVHRVLALRGFINQIAKQANVSDDQILGDYAQAIQIATRNEEKQLVLSKLSLVRHRRALEMARGLASEAALKASAEAAVQSIEKLLAMPARVTASTNLEAARLAIDKDSNTRWDTSAAQAGGEWFRIELDEERSISGLVLDARGSDGDFPRGYEVYVSASSVGDGSLVAKGKGTDAVTKIVFEKPVRGKAIKIVQTGQVAGLFWSIHELTVESQPVDQK